MKISKKILPILMSVMLLVVALPNKADAAEGNPGSTVTVSFPFSGIYGIQGTLNYSNPDLFSSISISATADKDISKAVHENNFAIVPSDGSEIKGSVQVTVTISSSAKAGDSCTISVSDCIGTSSTYDDINYTLSPQTVTVVSTSAGTGSESGTSGTGSGSSSGSSTTSSSKKPSTTTTTTSPSTSSSAGQDTTDYTELNKQIEIAGTKTKDGYTKESWTAFEQALANANAAVGCGNQDTVDAAAKALSDAIDGLVEMDYSALEKALKNGKSLIESDDLGSLWAQLNTAIGNYTDLLTSDDQEAVDAAAKEIQSIIDKINKLLDADTVAAEPTDAYCNIPMHKVWPILFFISLAGNVVLVVLLVGKKKKKEKKNDDTPMVDYEIGDDDL